MRRLLGRRALRVEPTPARDEDEQRRGRAARVALAGGAVAVLAATWLALSWNDVAHVPRVPAEHCKTVTVTTVEQPASETRTCEPSVPWFPLGVTICGAACVLPWLLDLFPANSKVGPAGVERGAPAEVSAKDARAIEAMAARRSGQRNEASDVDGQPPDERGKPWLRRMFSRSD